MTQKKIHALEIVCPPPGISNGPLLTRNILVDQKLSHSCISDAIVRQQDREEMQIVALLQKITYQQHKGTNDIFCISLEWLNNEVHCSKEIAAVGPETACAIENAFPYDSPMFNRVVRVHRNDLVETLIKEVLVSNLQKTICVG